MNEYIDYVKLLFDKYLNKLLYLYYIVLIIAFIATVAYNIADIIAYFTDAHVDPHIYSSIKDGIEGFGISFALPVSMFLIVRFILLNVPNYTIKFMKYIKKDITDIHTKHNPESK